jgi:non-ribosomal peptide synthetase component E (peptide arylation enzyme)
MILGNGDIAASPASVSENVTLDEIFSRVAHRRPDALALADPPNRPGFTDGVPRKLTFADADRTITAIAGRLRQMGLSADAIVGIQLPNTVENILAILGVMRAGMIAAPLPLLWRRADMIGALAGIGGKALITCGHVGAFNHSLFAMRVAAEVFSIRYVCAFGNNLPDGVVSFDDLFAAEKPDPVRSFAVDQRSNPAAHVAAISFDVGEGGIVPVARSHLELLAGGLGVLLESKLAQDDTILSTLAPASFAGLCQTMLPWLLCGGTLMLHHPFDLPALIQQWQKGGRCGALMLPAPIAFCLAEAGMIADSSPAAIVASWRSPEQLSASPLWQQRDTGFVDVSIFGEVGLVAARRDPSGQPAPLPLGPVAAPRDSGSALLVAELSSTRRGTLGLRGPMTPHHNFPPGAERAGLPHLAIGPDGVIDTGFGCKCDDETKTLVVTGPPSGIVNVGGYRLPLRDLQDVVGRIDAAASLAAMPDPLIGQRLVGHAADCHTMQAALGAVGVNPIVVSAFREGGDPPLADRAHHG